MNELCLIGLGLAALVVGWMIGSIITAPYGHEDADGFHYDAPPDAALGHSNAPKR